MARKKKTADQEQTTEPTKEQVSTEQAPPQAKQEGESVSGYFKRLFDENPKWLKSRSNEELLQRWLQDHPGHTDVPQNVKNGLANTKSVLRKKGRKQGGRKKAEAVNGAEPSVSQSSLAVTKTRTRRPDLETLEERIDDCLTEARQLDAEGLQDVIGLLRRARNAVVWKIGE